MCLARWCWRCFFFSSRRRHTRFDCDWSSDVCSSDLDRRFVGRNLELGEQARANADNDRQHQYLDARRHDVAQDLLREERSLVPERERDRKSTRLNSSHSQISYAVFCLKKKKKYKECT